MTRLAVTIAEVVLMASAEPLTPDRARLTANQRPAARRQCDEQTGRAHSCNAYQGDPCGTCGATSSVSCSNAKSGELCWTKDLGNKTGFAY